MVFIHCSLLNPRRPQQTFCAPFDCSNSAQRTQLIRLANLAGRLPLTIVLGFKDGDTINEDTKPKAKSV
jgi:hypothetical protein